ncbi:D-alanyl-D-alanine carboxypeptidase family protein [Cohnella sp. GCM10027633]|uniref:M15 family metallopeptidase n=1 Tax=unclassified Cohnella TaxID=2636738 RepID=UPI003634F473
MYRLERRSLIVLAALSLALTACAHTLASPQTGEALHSTAIPTSGTPNIEAATQEAGVGEKVDMTGNTEASILALVNKKNPLPSSYAPEDLVTVAVPTVLDNPEVNQARKEPADALVSLFAAAEEAGYRLYARSGYRSYATQEALYAGYSDKHGEDEANRFSAKAGQSEHQTGLAMDITSESVSLQLSEDFGMTEEGQWVAANAHRYGFIIRYPQDQEKITGYLYEPWHLRYLGVDMATQVYESGLTYEQFVSERG